MFIFLSAMFVFLCLNIVLLIRNAIVYKHRGRAIALVSEKMKQAIREDREWESVSTVADRWDSYEKMLWSFTKWRFEDFFPELNKERPTMTFKQ
jgi:hypothetical protein